MLSSEGVEDESETWGSKLAFLVAMLPDLEISGGSLN